MPTARDIADIFEQIAPIESGLRGDQLGFVHGDPRNRGSCSGLSVEHPFREPAEVRRSGCEYDHLSRSDLDGGAGQRLV